MDRDRLEITKRSLPSGSTMLMRSTSISVNFVFCAAWRNAATESVPSRSVTTTAYALRRRMSRRMSEDMGQDSGGWGAVELGALHLVRPGRGLARRRVLLHVGGHPTHHLGPGEGVPGVTLARAAVGEL